MTDAEDKPKYRLFLQVQRWVVEDTPDNPNPLKGHWENLKDDPGQSLYTAGTHEQVEEARKDILMPEWRKIYPPGKESEEE